MNQNEINEKISVWFEPKPTWLKRHMPWDGPAYLSDGTFWFGCDEREGEIDWDAPPVITKPRPLDYFTDEAANALLLEAMKPNEPSLTWNLDLEEWEVEFIDGGFREGCEIIAKHADRKTAVVLTFLKFAWIE